MCQQYSMEPQHIVDNWAWRFAGNWGFHTQDGPDGDEDAAAKRAVRFIFAKDEEWQELWLLLLEFDAKVRGITSHSIFSDDQICVFRRFLSCI